MKTNKYILGLLGLGVMMMAGCTQDNEHQVNQSPNKMLLTSTIGATTRSTNQNLQSSQLVNGSTIGVYVTDEANSVICDNIKATADGDGGFTYSRDLFWPVEGKASIYAYGPYQESFTKKLGEAATFTVAEDQTTDDGYLASDLVFGLPVNKNPLEQTTSAVPLAFNHMLVKVNISVVNDTQTSLEGATVSLKDIATTVTMNTKTGEIGASSGKGTVKAATFPANATSYKCSAIIAPQKMTYGSKVVLLTLKNGSSMAATLHSDMDLKSGKTYNFSINVVVGGMDLTVTASSLSDWDNNTSGLTADIDLDDVQTPEQIVPDDTPATEKLYATFKKPASSASYSEPTYSWTGSTNNLMTCFEFSGGELANYDKLTFTLSNISSGGKVRIGYFVGTTWKELANYDSNGQKTIDLTTISNRSEIVRISFGGNSNSGSVDVKASDMYLSNDAPTPVFGKPGNGATYTAPTYSWTATTGNLMDIYKFENGELKNYKTLTFTIANLTGGMVRMGVYYDDNGTSTWKEFINADSKSGFGSNGPKTIDLTAQGIDLSKVTKICFGGKSGTGSVDIAASDVSLSK